MINPVLGKVSFAGLIAPGLMRGGWLGDILILGQIEMINVTPGSMLELLPTAPFLSLQFSL